MLNNDSGCQEHPVVERHNYSNHSDVYSDHSDRIQAGLPQISSHDCGLRAILIYEFIRIILINFSSFDTANYLATGKVNTKVDPLSG